MTLKSRIAAAATFGALIVAVLWVSPAAAVTAGTWEQSPTGSTQYQASVQQPINTANTSNWSSKSKGGIPVMFKLQSGTSPAVFQSVWSDQNTNTDNDVAYMSFTPGGPMKLADLTDLSATYAFQQGDCAGGALRWSLSLDVNGDGVRDGSAWVYYGDTASGWTTCTGAAYQSGTNMLSLNDAR